LGRNVEESREPGALAGRIEDLVLVEVWGFIGETRGNSHLTDTGAVRAAGLFLIVLFRACYAVIE